MSRRTRKNFVMHAGNDRRVIVPVVDQANNPIDLSGAQEITWIIAKRPGGNPIVEKTLTGDDIMITNNTTFKFDINPSDTENKSGHYYHEAQVLNSAGKVYTPLYGTINILPTSIEV